MSQHTIDWQGSDVHARTYWSDGAWAGLIAGVAFMMLEMFLVWALQGQSPWAPPHMIAAMVMGEGVLPETGTYAAFDFGVVMVAMVVHLVLSVVLGLLGAWIVHRFDMGVALVVGAVYGWAIYIVNFLMVAPILFPWFAMARGGISIFAHVVFGAVLTGAYIMLRRRHVRTPR